MVQRRVSAHQRQVSRERARVMRHAPERSEAFLWEALSRRQLGVCFRRQVVLRGFIADFYASEAKLIVEVDGPWHAKCASADAWRDRVLSRGGYRVLRVSAEDVLCRPHAVVKRIAAEVQGDRRD